MPDDGHRLPWTDEHWADIQRFVAESARRARVASSFLPLVGPLPGGQASVPKLLMEQSEPPQEWYGTREQRLDIDDSETMPLTTLACEVFIRTQQAEDPDLASTRQMLGRAAVLVGRLEDAIVFNGQPGRDEFPMREGVGVVQPDVYAVTGGGEHPGLLNANPAEADIFVPDGGADYGNNLVESVAEAVNTLEGRGQYGPFACTLGHDLYLAAHTPSHFLVLPSDRFVPFLAGGPLARSSTIPDGQGVVVALAGSPIDLVVATDVHVSFVQRTTEPRYVLRVSERMVLRVKQRDAVVRLMTTNAPAKTTKAPAKATKASAKTTKAPGKAT